MKDFVDKCAVITGGGGLLGRGMATTFAHRGMHVVIADVDQEAAARSVHDVEQTGRRAISIPTDVTDQASMDRLAEGSYSAFGAVPALPECRSLDPEALRRVDGGRLDESALRATRGRVTGYHRVPAPAYGSARRVSYRRNGIHVRSRACRSEEPQRPICHSQIRGGRVSGGYGPALSPHGIGVSVLCPGMTVEDPDSYRNAQVWKMPSAQWYEHNLLTPAQVASEVLYGVEENRLYIFPHRAGRGEVESRHTRLLEGFSQAERTSPPIESY